MPQGVFYSTTQTRAYTSQYPRIHANIFKQLLIMPLGTYSLSSKHLSIEHSKIQLSENKYGDRLVTFTINDTPHKIALKLDSRSASNKLYITCPYCQEQRQHLYAIKTAYACRECIGLHYASQSERPKERLMRCIRKLRTELWGNDWPEVNNMFKNIMLWPKPKWMRWNTFDKRRNEIIELEKKYWPLAAQHIEAIYGKLAR